MLKLLSIKSAKLALYAAIWATIIGLITFVLSWQLFDYFGGPIAGYSVLLFPGNLSLVYFWHPLFTEEVDLLPKLGMLLLGQFTIVYALALLVIIVIKRFVVSKNRIK